MPDNVLIATANDANGAHQKVVNEYLDAAGLPVSVTAATPLPVLASISTAGLATSTGQAAGNSSLSSIDGKTPALGQALITASTPVVLPVSQVTALTPPAAITGFATEATSAALNGKIPSGLVVTGGKLQVELPAGGGGLTNTELRLTPVPISGNLAVSNFPATQAVSAAALPLPTGAATEGGNLATIKTNTDKIPALGQALAAASTPVVLTAIQLSSLTPPAAITGFALASNQQTNAITNTEIRATPLAISGTVNTGLTQPLTDTQLRAAALPVTANAGTNLNTSALALDATLVGGTQKAILRTAAKGTTVAADTTSTNVDANTQALDVSVKGSIAVTGGLTDTQIRATPLPISGNVTANAGTNLNTSALALEAGNLATIKTNTDKIPALGQALAAASTPIVLTAIQQAALTPPAAITGFNLEATQLLVKAKTDNIPAQGQALAAASTPVVLTAAQIITLTPPAAITGFATAANQQTNAITDAQIRATALPVSGTFFQTTQPISGTVSTGLSQPLTDTQLRTTPVPVSGTVVTGGLTDTQIRATALPISGTVAANATLAAETTKVIGTVNVAGTVPISGTVTANTGLSQPLTDTQIRATAVPMSLATDADNTATGTLTAAAQTVVLTMGGKSAVGIVITGTWAGTITFEGTVDGTNWNSINAVAASTSTPQPTTIVNGLFRLTPAGLLQVRAIMTAFTSGTATVTMRASAGTGGIFANQTVPVTLISNPAEGVVSTVNSSVVALAANGVFTGTSEDVTNYSSITVALISNVASATDGLSLQQSPDGTNWDLLDVYTVPAATGKTFSAHISSKFYRLVYTNGATLQGSFRLQTIYHKYQQPAATVRPQDGRANDNDFGEELSFLMGYNSIANAWNRVGVTSGNLGGNETILDRLKVNASLRMIDTAQTVGSQLVGATGTQALGLNVNLRTSSTLAVTTTAATGVAATLTIPAVAAQFHYITSLKMVLYSTAARTGTATPIVVTSTNAPGALAFTFDTAGAIGTSVAQEAISVMPLKSSVLNTATTIVAPAVVGGIWRITATYFTGA